MEFLGYAEENFYFMQSGKIVSVNETTNVVSNVSNFSTISLSTDVTISSIAEELAHSALTNLDIKVVSTKNRMYTIPNSVQNTAKTAIQVFDKKDVPAISRSTAEMLASGGQIGLEQVNHLARYFFRHIDESSRTFSAFWGGKSAENWISSIINRENISPETYSTSTSMELTEFSVLDGQEEDFSSFYIRLFSDGSGFDLLLKRDSNGELSVWEDGVWYNTDTVSSVLSNESEFFYVPIDEESAIKASAFIDEKVNQKISVSELNYDESSLVALAVYDLNFSEIDEVMVLEDNIQTVFSDGENMYVIPKSVQSEAKRGLAWHKEYGRGGTSVGLNTARTLSRGGKIGIRKVRHIAKYFPRHEVDSKGKGYRQGQDGYPSNGRIAWALWGGDAARRWASAIVERENKNLSSMSVDNDSYEFYGRSIPSQETFDRLYRKDSEGILSVWEDGVWYDLGECYTDFFDIDSNLSAESDSFEHVYTKLDYESVVAAAVAPSPTAAPTPATQDSVYTPQERSANAQKQTRDATGRFAVAGNRARYSKNQSISGTITNVDQASGNVTIKTNSGESFVVPAKDTLPEDTQHRYPIVPQTPMDTNGILGEQSTSAVQKRAELPNTNPVQSPADIFTLLSDWPRWVADQRATQKGVELPQVKVNSQKDWAKAPNAYNDPYLRKWLDQKKVGKDGSVSHPNRFWYQPLPDAYKTSVEGKKSPSKIYASALIAGAENTSVPLTPEGSDIPPVYMAIVAADDPQAVMDLICLIPRTSTSTSPATFTFRNGKWEQDARILADLKSPTPPPVVVLDNEQLESVVQQMEETSNNKKEMKKAEDASQNPTELSVDELLALALQYEAEENALIAAGGLDQNRGNAEKLRHYWTVGKGGMKIRWGTGGDWTRCVRHLSKYLGPRAKGYCALRHKEMTALWTGDKAHRQMYGHNGGRFATSDEMLLTTEEIIQKSVIRAQVEELKNRVLVASGGFTAPVESSIDGAKFKIPLVVPEGIETGDGRKFSSGAITMREFPLPLLWQIKTAEGHNGSVVVGRIDHMERIDGGIGNAYGVFDSGEYGREAERLVRGGFIRGISADLDRFEASEEPEENSTKNKKKYGGSRITINKARVMGVTLVPKPAFQECTIQLVEEPTAMELSDQDALVACASVVAAIPVVPPRSWFDNPKLGGPTPLTVTDDGRVFGHIAAWHVDHIGLSFGTKPPRSRSGYAYFHTGVIRTDDGADVPVGQLTLAGGHAPLSADARSAAKHYDDTASSFADVHAGEDAHGIWVSGALRPSITPEQVRAIRASAPSGDWRPIMGSLELVAVCQVNVPGFPIARARVASGEVYALVAAGASYLARIKADPSVLQAAENAKTRFAAIRSEMETKTTITAGIEMEMKENEPLTVEVLERLLAGVVDFSYRAWGFHWNVTGEDFVQYHDLFGKIQADVDGSIDPLAENIRKIGGFPHIKLSDYAAESTLPPCNIEGGDPKELSAHLLMANEVLIKELNAAYNVFEAAKDQAICNFLADRLDMHHKWSWQLASSISPSELILSEDEGREEMLENVFALLAEQGLTASIDMFATFTEEQRKELAKKGEALPDGSYPIRNVSDLKNAIHAYGRSKPSDRAKVRAHIRKRAKALGHPELIPDTFASEALELSAAVEDLRTRVKSASMTASGTVTHITEANPKN